MKLCIINVSDGKFIKGQERLRQSLQQTHDKADLLFFDHLLPDWPKHEKVPWGFKIYAFEEAYQKGYDMALWIDAAGIVVRPLDKIIKILEKDGVFTFSRYNTSVGEWCADKTLDAFGLTRKQAFHIPEIAAFCYGINFRHPTGQKFFELLKNKVTDGISFLGLPPIYTTKDVMSNDKGLISSDTRVKGQRGDQTVASLIINQLKIKPTARLCFDLIGEAKKGKSYADYIPIDTIVVQNRDIKTEKYLTGLSTYTTPWQNKNVIYMTKTIYKSVIRYLKDFVKWHIFYKKRYNI